MKTENARLPVYSIGTVARMLGISVQTLRLYESEGLLLVRKSAGGQRLYSEADIERLECIRRAITEEKVGIGGIRRMQSLVPCWRIVGCTPAERDTCAAYSEHAGGCWTHHHQKNVCAAKECIACEVYLKSTTCAGIKEMIQQETEAGL